MSIINLKNINAKWSILIQFKLIYQFEEINLNEPIGKIHLKESTRKKDSFNLIKISISKNKLKKKTKFLINYSTIKNNTGTNLKNLNKSK